MTEPATQKERMLVMGAEARLVELKLELPPAPKPVATYVTAIRHGDLLYVSGHGPYRSDGTLIIGRLGDDDGRRRPVRPRRGRRAWRSWRP